MRPLSDPTQAWAQMHACDRKHRLEAPCSSSSACSSSCSGLAPLRDRAVTECSAQVPRLAAAEATAPSGHLPPVSHACREGGVHPGHDTRQRAGHDESHGEHSSQVALRALEARVRNAGCLLQLMEQLLIVRDQKRRLESTAGQHPVCPFTGDMEQLLSYLQVRHSTDLCVAHRQCQSCKRTTRKLRALLASPAGGCGSCNH